MEGGRLELDAGVELTRAPDSLTLGVPLSLGAGVGGWVEADVSPSALYVVNDSGSPRQAVGVGDLFLGVKVVLPAQPLGLDLALAPSVKVPTADERRSLGTGEVDGSLLLIATYALGEDRKAHLNLGYTFVGRPRGQRLRDRAFVGAAVESGLPAGIPRRLRLVGEVFGTTEREADGHADVQARLGVQYAVSDDLIVDAGIGRSLTAPVDAELFVTIGVSWTFDAPWKRPAPEPRKPD